MKVERETTNGVIYDGGTIVKNGLRIVCPFCGEVGLHHGHGGSVNVWTVGAIERRGCTKCPDCTARHDPGGLLFRRQRACGRKVTVLKWSITTQERNALVESGRQICGGGLNA